MRLAQRSAPNTHVDMSLLPTTKHLNKDIKVYLHVKYVKLNIFPIKFGCKLFNFYSLGVVGPVDAGGFIVRAVVALVQNKGIKLTLLSGSVVHQGDVFLRDDKLPVKKKHVTMNSKSRIQEEDLLIVVSFWRGTRPSLPAVR